MLPIDTPQPRRTVLWDEATASYIWLDARERDAARAIRARRNDFQSNTPAGVYNSGLADLWNPDQYDASTRQAARVREYQHRPEIAARRRAKAAAVRNQNTTAAWGTTATVAAASAFAAGFDPIRFDEVVPYMADILAALVAPPSLSDVLDGMRCEVGAFDDLLS